MHHTLKAVHNLAAPKSSYNISAFYNHLSHYSVVQSLDVKNAGEYIWGSSPINYHTHKAVQNKAPSRSSDHKSIFDSLVLTFECDTIFTC